MRLMKNKNNNQDAPIKTSKKIFNIISTAIVSVVFVVVVCTCLSLIIQMAGGKKPSLFGYRFYYVLTDSMTPTLEVNDVILSEVLKPEEVQKDLEVGDIVTYDVEYGDLKGVTITHRVVSTAYFDEEYDRLCIKTQGDKLGAPVDEPVPVENVQAVMVKKVNALSSFYRFFSSRVGLIGVVVVPFAIMMGVLIFRLITIIKKPEKEEDTQTPAPALPPEEIAKRAVEEYIAIEAKKKEIAERAVQEYIEAQKNNAQFEEEITSTEETTSDTTEE